MAQPGGEAPRLGRYELLGRVAGGGMATVYLARTRADAGFERLFALKCLKPELTQDEEFVKMFLDEARLAGRLRHENTCPVSDVGNDQGVHYLAMEYLEGQPLSSLMREWALNPPPPAERAMVIARVIADAAEGLHHAHELKDDAGGSLDVIHRDISPQNIFVTYDGSVKLVDFGIARAAGRLHETTKDALKGKFAYMSPEHVCNAPLDRRTDIWALGVILWEAMALKRLFHRPGPVATVQAILQHDVPPIAELAPGSPLLLSTIVTRCLAQSADERYPTAAAVAEDLNRFVALEAEPFARRELAELMERTFAEERQRRAAAIEAAREGAHGPDLPAEYPSAVASTEANTPGASGDVETLAERPKTADPAELPTVVGRPGARASAETAESAAWSSRVSERAPTRSGATPAAPPTGPAPAAGSLGGLRLALLLILTLLLGAVAGGAVILMLSP